MKKLENKEKITELAFERSIQPFCPLGNDYYNAEIHVDFEPRDYYMDYCEVDEEIQKLGGKPFTIEQVADCVFDMLMYFQPKNLCVTVTAGSNKHFPVSVTKDSNWI